MSKKNGEAAKTAASTDSATGYSFHRPFIIDRDFGEADYALLAAFSN